MYPNLFQGALAAGENAAYFFARKNSLVWVCIMKIERFGWDSTDCAGDTALVAWILLRRSDTRDSYNGSIADFDSVGVGSSPASRAIILTRRRSLAQMSLTCVRTGKMMCKSGFDSQM